MNFNEFQKTNEKAINYFRAQKHNNETTQDAGKICLDATNIQNKYRALFNINVKDFIKYFNEYLNKVNNKDSKSNVSLYIEDVKTVRQNFNDPYSNNSEPTEYITTSYIATLLLKDTEETVQLAKGSQSLVTNNKELKEKQITAEEIRKSQVAQNIEFNLLSNPYLHIPSMLNPKENTALSSINIDDAMWYVAHKNFVAQKEAKIAQINQKTKELKEEKATYQTNEINLDLFVKI